MKQFKARSFAVIRRHSQSRLHKQSHANAPHTGVYNGKQNRRSRGQSYGLRKGRCVFRFDLNVVRVGGCLTDRQTEGVCSKKESITGNMKMPAACPLLTEGYMYFCTGNIRVV